MIEIIPESPDKHAAAIEALYDRTFGPGHFAKTAERLREGNASLPEVTRVAVSDGKMVGVCRVWSIFVGADRTPAVFIGPVAVSPDFQGQRLGLTITGESLEAATKAGWGAAIIIGSRTYFGELGFTPVAPDRFTFPGPQDMARVMVRDLAGSADALSGALSAI
ncbi:MAG: N-acetyltransferase [Cognatishimia sp.]|nr:N-acetyltransferase [Cognatishimia sp.]NQY40428.1 N-acetyltransferase [Henriciella sp.]